MHYKPNAVRYPLNVHDRRSIFKEPLSKGREMILQFLVLLFGVLLVVEGSWILINPMKAKQITVRLLKHPNTLRTLGLIELIGGLLIATYAFRGQ